MVVDAKTLKKLGIQLKQRYGDRLTKLVLFGSQARRDADTMSDIDVLVVLKSHVDSMAEIKANNQWLSDFCLGTEQLVNCVYISDIAFVNENTALSRNIRREGVLSSRTKIITQKSA